MVDEANWIQSAEQSKTGRKKGVVVKEIPFDDSLVKGIWEVYNECPVRQGRRFSHYGKSIEKCMKKKRHFSTAAFSSERISGRV